MPESPQLRVQLEDLLLRLKVHDRLHLAELNGRRLILAAELRDSKNGATREQASEDAALDIEAARLAGREEVEQEILSLLLRSGRKDNG